MNAKKSNLLLIIVTVVTISTITGPQLYSGLSAIRTTKSPKLTALVIGAATYPHAVQLQNPIYDARTVAKTLKEAGYEVTLLEDPDRKSLAASIKSFGEKSEDEGGIHLVYFSGLGFEVNGQPFIAPVDADINSVETVEMECIKWPVLTHIAETHVHIFSTSSGQTASDGLPGENLSPFTNAFTNHFPTKALAIPELVEKISEEVVNKTQAAQKPFFKMRASSNIILNPKKPREVTSTLVTIFDSCLDDPLGKAKR